MSKKLKYHVVAPPLFSEHVKNWNEKSTRVYLVYLSILRQSPPSPPPPRIRILKILKSNDFFLVIYVFLLVTILSLAPTFKKDATCLNSNVKKYTSMNLVCIVLLL